MTENQDKYGMENYPDSKCIWGYMTVCNGCIDRAPSWVDTENPITNQWYPIVECEVCGKVNKGN